MGISSKHAYRYGYLKSEKWQTLRIAALAKKDARCQICNERSLSNDVHHVYYPPSFWDTTVEDVVILCRDCHDFVHSMMELTAKSSDEKDRDRCYARFKAISAAFKEWLVNRGVVKPVRSRSMPHCVVCRSQDDIELREALPAKPAKGSMWILCLNCHEQLKIKAFTSFPELRKYMVDVPKVTCD